MDDTAFVADYVKALVAIARRHSDGGRGAPSRKRREVTDVLAHVGPMPRDDPTLEAFASGRRLSQRRSTTHRYYEPIGYSLSRPRKLG